MTDWTTDGLNLIANDILNGETFAPDLLAQINLDSSPVVLAKKCDFTGLRNLALLRVALVENAIQANEAERADLLLIEAADVARRGLLCNPADTVSWTILAWIEFVRNDDTPRLRALLNMSYKTGPYEGWALVRRTELLLHIFPALDPVSIAQLQSQLNWLISVGAMEFIGDLYLKAEPKQKSFLFEVLSKAPRREQKRVAEVIWDNGGDIDLPLVESRGNRPWN